MVLENILITAWNSSCPCPRPRPGPRPVHANPTESYWFMYSPPLRKAWRITPNPSNAKHWNGHWTRDVYLYIGMP